MLQAIQATIKRRTIGHHKRSAAHISTVAHGDGLTVLQWRVKKGMAMRDPEDEIFSPQKNIQTIQVERKGDAYTMRIAKKGEALQTVGSHQMPDLPTPLFVGLYICSHNPEKVEEAIVRNVQIVQAKP